MEIDRTTITETPLTSSTNFRCLDFVCEEVETEWSDSGRFSTAPGDSVPSTGDPVDSTEDVGCDVSTSDSSTTVSQEKKAAVISESSDTEYELVPSRIPVFKKPRSSTVTTPRYVIHEDLSNGQELYPVRVWNTVDKETITPFVYIKQTQHFTNYKKTPVVCDCEDGCDGPSCKCLGEPFHENKTEASYKEDGTLKEIPDWWYYQSRHRVLYECSDLCRCGPECCTRSAQLGLRTQLEVFKTSRKGWGVRTLRNIRKGSFIAEYAGVMTESKDDDPFVESVWYSFDITSEDGPTNFFIDASKKGNVSRFINHGCSPNLIAMHVFYDDNNPIMGAHICFYASGDIDEMEELTFDYGSDYWRAKLKKGIECECASRQCEYRNPKLPKKKRRRY